MYEPEYCLGNKIHACSIKYASDANDLANYFNGIMEGVEYDINFTNLTYVEFVKSMEYQKKMMDLAKEVLIS